MYVNRPVDLAGCIDHWMKHKISIFFMSENSQMQQELLLEGSWKQPSRIQGGMGRLLTTASKGSTVHGDLFSV